MQTGVATPEPFKDDGLRFEIDNSQSKNSKSSSMKNSTKKERKSPLPHYSTVMYSLPIPNFTPKEGQSIPRRHPVIIDGPLTTSYDDSIKSLYDVFKHTANAYPTKAFLGTRRKLDSGAVGPYVWKSYQEISDDVSALASSFYSLGLKRGDFVGIFAINQEEWLVSEYASYSRSLITVPLYDTLGPESIIHICNQVELSIIVISRDKAMTLLKLVKDLKFIKHLIIIDSLTDELLNAFKDTSIKLVSYSSLLEQGAKNKVEDDPPAGSDISTVCYTSGTTGLPKGAVYVHSAVIAMLSGLDLLIRNSCIIHLDFNEIHLSYLPLAHIFERVVTTYLIRLGASIGFFQGDTLKILDDVGELKPTVFISVPRLFNRIYEKVFIGLKSKGSVGQYIFNMAYQSKLKALQQGQLTHWLWDRLVFSAIKSRLGGRVKGMITGSAPISAEVLQFLRVAFSCEVYEGYGQTETCAATCITQRGDYSVGHIGVPTPSNEIMLVDIPEMSYCATGNPPRGEICIRGPSCFSYYYKDPEKTAETIDQDGWVHSGDVGEWDSQGRLKIVDRKKNIFKLAQGEYIAPEKIENCLTQSPLIEQIFINGNSLKASLVAVVVPNKEAFVQDVASKFTDMPSYTSAPDTFDFLFKNRNAELNQFILGELNKFARSKTSLKGFEIPKALYIEASPFSVQNNLLTSTFKLKRYEATVKYKSIIEDLYASLKE